MVTYQIVGDDEADIKQRQDLGQLADRARADRQVLRRRGRGAGARRRRSRTRFWTCATFDRRRVQREFRNRIHRINRISQDWQDCLWRVRLCSVALCAFAFGLLFRAGFAPGLTRVGAGLGAGDGRRCRVLAVDHQHLADLLHRAGVERLADARQDGIALGAILAAYLHLDQLVALEVLVDVAQHGLGEALSPISTTGWSLWAWALSDLRSADELDHFGSLCCEILQFRQHPMSLRGLYLALCGSDPAVGRKPGVRSKLVKRNGAQQNQQGLDARARHRSLRAAGEAGGLPLARRLQAAGAGARRTN